MKVLALITALTALISVAFGQDPVQKEGISQAKKKQAASRMERITEAARYRMAREADEWFDKGDFPRVVSLMYVRVELNTQDYDAFTDLIWMLGNVERKEEALVQAIRFADLNPSDPDAYFPAGQIHFFARRYAAAIPTLEKSISFPKPAHPNSYRMLAQTWRRLGMNRQAVRVWNKMTKHYPNDKALKANLSRGLQELLKFTP